MSEFSHDVESGFEALLKPLQDINSQVWDIMLTQALENYLVQINNGSKAIVNFTEAAVVVQNSASFYCKRVDSVHLGCQKFVENLLDTYNNFFGKNRIMKDIVNANLDLRNDKMNGDVDGQAVKKKRIARLNVKDDFECMDLFCGDSNIDLDLETIDRYADKKKVILEKYPKVQKKMSTSYPVYQSKGAQMGLKDEFRLNFGISSNGVISEDFVSTKNPVLINWGPLPDDVHEVVSESFAQLENSFVMNVDPVSDIIPPPPLDTCDSRGPSPLPPCDSPLRPASPAGPQPDPKVQIKRTITDPYKEHIFNFTLPPISKQKKKNFTLPKTLIDEVTEWKILKNNKKLETTDGTYTYNCFFNLLKHTIFFNSSSCDKKKIKSSAKERRREILLRHKILDKAACDAAKELNQDFHGFDIDDNVLNDNMIDDMDIVHEDDDIAVNIEIPDLKKEDYATHKEELMAAYQANKRRCAAELTEVAQRVQAWHESLANTLENAEARAQFDVHDYGTKVLDVFTEPPEKKPVIPFKQIVANQSKPEVSRFLLASLMLANTYNIEIMQDEGHLVKDCLRLKLLSTVRHHEEMDENLKSMNN